jgi:hypothetical protein
MTIQVGERFVVAKGMLVPRSHDSRRRQRCPGEVASLRAEALEQLSGVDGVLAHGGNATASPSRS